MQSAPSSGQQLVEKLLPLTPMRKTIAERMVKSRQTSAHVVTFFEADFSGIARFREGRSLTFLPFVINAVTRAMKDEPMLNSSWGEQGIMVKKEVHMGIAVALDDGLLVPVVRNAHTKGLTVLATEVADLAERARTKRLLPEEVQGGTFTITNHGGAGSLFSTPIGVITRKKDRKSARRASPASAGARPRVSIRSRPSARRLRRSPTRLPPRLRRSKRAWAAMARSGPAARRAWHRTTGSRRPSPPAAGSIPMP